jgi:hypothetical protein
MKDKIDPDYTKLAEMFSQKEIAAPKQHTDDSKTQNRTSTHVHVVIMITKLLNIFKQQLSTFCCVPYIKHISIKFTDK